MTTVEAFSRIPGGRSGFGRPPGFLHRAVREPLLHFLLLGALIFVLADLRGGTADRYRIVIDDARVAKLAQTYTQQFGGPPSPKMLGTLVDNYINEEIFYREGITMRLDQDDEVIRRRVVQKVQFLEQDLTLPEAPSEADMRNFYDRHPARYEAPARASFTHIYFSPDKGGDANARARALAVLSGLKDSTARAPERGDAYPDLYDYSSISPNEALKLFGRTPIATALFRTPSGHWAGPFRSGYGWHLVYVTALQPAHLAPFDDVRAQVRSDFLAQSGAEANQRNFSELKSRYTIVRGGSAP